jgi:hypothetical protein
MLCFDNPLFLKGLTWEQRYCYFNGMIHFWFGIPRIIFYLSPIVYLVFGIHPVRVSFVDYAAMALPFIFLASWSNSYIFRNFRHSFWADVYEALLAAPYAMTVLWCLIDPRTGKFNVTPKGTTITKSYLDWISVPNLTIMTLLLIAFGFGVHNLLVHPGLSEKHAIWINLGWSFYNICTLIPAILCALEHAFTKRTHPVKRALPVDIFTGNQTAVQYGTTQSMTEFGCQFKLDRELPVAPIRLGDEMRLVLHSDSNHYPEITVDAKVSYLEFTKKRESLIGVDFLTQDTNTLRALIETIYCQEGMWANLTEPDDSFMLAFGNLVSTPWRVFVLTRHWLTQDRVVELARTMKEARVPQKS